MKDNIHTPVLLKESIEGLDIQRDKRYVDATVGAGGHTQEIIRHGGKVLGIDTDEQILAKAQTTLATLFPQKKEGIDWTLVKGNFGNIGQICRSAGFEHICGLLFDLGVSSFQLDTKDRGFSYRYEEAPLDMRLDQQSGESGAQYINTLSEENLYDIFATYGEEQLSRPIARAIVIARRLKPIETTGQLKDIIKNVERNVRQQPRVLSKIFQALRIYINNELGVLKEALESSIELVEPGGRIAVISFHSLEDRIVKQFLDKPQWRLVTKRPIVPTEYEVEANPRARSAKLRIAQRI